MKPETQAFMLKDYELKIRYLSDHYSRMWSRCNFFVGLESAMTVALFAWFKDKGVFSHGAMVIAVAGAVSSLCWYIFGAQDRYLAELYREQVKLVGGKLAGALKVWDEFKCQDHGGERQSINYTTVGDTETVSVRMTPYQWRVSVFSTTKLAAWFPLLVLTYWVFMIILIARS
jgi:hypothetical protein